MQSTRWFRALVIMLLTAAFTLSAPASFAAYPGRDGRVALSRHNQIYTVKMDGSRQKRLTSAGKNYRPRWSPNGRRIAYIHETATGVKNIWVMRSDGTHKRRVTRVGGVTAPSWSPDGRWLVFGSPLQKVRSSAPFGRPVPLLGTYADDEEPHVLAVDGPVAWSPDGRHIAYYTHEVPDSPDSYLQVYDASTQESQTWSAVGGECCGFGYFSDPAWAPDGGRLAYTDGSYWPEVPPVPAPPVITVTAYPQGGLVAYASKTGDRQPAFSPSGKYMAVMNHGKIYLTKADGTGRHRLTAGYHPDFQPLP